MLVVVVGLDLGESEVQNPTKVIEAWFSLSWFLVFICVFHGVELPRELAFEMQKMKFQSHTKWHEIPQTWKKWNHICITEIFQQQFFLKKIVFYEYTLWLSWWPQGNLLLWWWKWKGYGGFASSRSNCITVCLLWITNSFPCISLTQNFPIQVHDHVQASMSCTCPSVAIPIWKCF
jgi:hypothetical protein